MHFIQIIYCNNKPLIITDDAARYRSAHVQADAYPVFTGDVPQNVADALAVLSQEDSKGAVIEHPSQDAVIQELYKLYEPVDAGGGVVLNEKDELLMIYRRGKWDLPKGKRDKGETMEDCALREVSEETGLQQLSLGEKVCDTYHAYYLYGKNQLKHTAWYIMHASAKEQLLPQAEENIEEVKWVAKNDLGQYTANTYEAIRDVLRSAGLE